MEFLLNYNYNFYKEVMFCLLHFVVLGIYEYDQKWSNKLLFEVFQSVFKHRPLKPNLSLACRTD